MRQDSDTVHEGGTSRTKLSEERTFGDPLQKTGEVKRAFDFLIVTPGKLRKGVARSGSPLLGFTEYNMKLFRSEDRQWTLYLEWVDLEGNGHRIVIPHTVVQGILQRANSIIAECRRDRAQRGAQTRKQRNHVKVEN